MDSDEPIDMGLPYKLYPCTFSIILKKNINIITCHLQFAERYTIFIFLFD